MPPEMESPLASTVLGPAPFLPPPNSHSVLLLALTADGVGAPTTVVYPFFFRVFFFFVFHIFDSFIPSSCGGDILFTAGFLVVSSRDPSLAFVILFCHFGRILQREALRSLAHFPFR